MIAFLFRHSFWIGIAVAILLVGEANPNERLVYFSLPLNTAMVVILAATALMTPTAVESLRFTGWSFFLISISLVYGLTLSQNFEYALYKGANLFVIVLTISVSFQYYYKNNQQDKLWKVVILIMLAYLIGALLFKLKNGFWDRQVVFLMNGPIVFARLMGMAAILTLLFTKGPLRIALFTIFLLAVLWSSSKGPLLAMILVLALMMIAHGRLVALSIIAIIIVTPFLLIPEQVFNVIRLLDGTGRIAVIIESLTLGSELSDAHSVTFGSRSTAYIKTLHLIAQYPMGVGLGDWQIHTREIIQYPHNFFLEAISELGVIFGILFVLPYVWSIFGAKNKLLWVVIFFAINQQVSGDLLDSRYWLLFGVLACLPTREGDVGLLKALWPKMRGEPVRVAHITKPNAIP
ncbi:MAG: O-antigen ligase family protein [Geminicoccales bacterium]